MFIDITCTSSILISISPLELSFTALGPSIILGPVIAEAIPGTIFIIVPIALKVLIKPIIVVESLARPSIGK